MDPNSPPFPSNDTVPTWFDATPVAPPPKRFPKKLVIVIAIAILLLIGIALAAMAVIAKSSSSTCLTKADYRDLTGITYADTLSPTDNFDTETINFQTGSASYSDATATTSLITRIGTFYKTHSQRSILFTVDASYEQDTEYDLAQNRIQAVIAALIAAGVPDELISNGIPQQITSEEDTPTTTTGSVSLEIVSAESCQ